MAMQRFKEGLRGLGHHDLAEKQASIQAELRRRNPGMDDISLKGKLPQVVGAQNAEIIKSPLSAETQKLIEQMRSDGYAVYETTGRTPASLKSDGMHYWFLDPKLADITAPPALLAFKKAPSELFLPGSFNIPHDKQVEFLLEKRVKTNNEYPGAGLIVREGKLPEWTELALKHFKATGVRIFGKDYRYDYTWTDTYESEKSGARRANFGFWSGMVGADAGLWNPDGVPPGLGLASLVEIPRK